MTPITIHTQPTPEPVAPVLAESIARSAPGGARLALGGHGLYTGMLAGALTAALGGIGWESLLPVMLVFMVLLALTRKPRLRYWKRYCFLRPWWRTRWGREAVQELCVPHTFVFDERALTLDGETIPYAELELKQILSSGAVLVGRKNRIDCHRKTRSLPWLIPADAMDEATREALVALGIFCRSREGL